MKKEKRDFKSLLKKKELRFRCKKRKDGNSNKIHFNQIKIELIHMPEPESTEPEQQILVPEKITLVNIEDEMKRSYIDYAMSVIVGRALPDVRDGLKPVHRRILYAMNEQGMTHDKPYKKSARIVGDVLGKYHPHGDIAVYDSLVRMVQEFSLRYPLIDGQGNFGSIDGDSAAAMRYTEVRLGKIADEILGDIDKETVDFVPNYDDSLKEPSVLPCKLPNLLINGSTGIAVGMATNMPPHNLGEVIDGITMVIDNPAVEWNELMTAVKGPDFPTAGFIYGRQGISRCVLHRPWLDKDARPRNNRGSKEQGNDHH